MRCATHPEVETNLRCSKCGKLICPTCLVQTPVGARCQDCARLHQLPTYRVSTQYYLRAIGAGLGMAIACGAIWGMLKWKIPFFSFDLLLAPAAGYATGEIVSLSVNHKRGTGLAVIGGIAVAMSYLVTFLFPGELPFSLFNILYHLLALALGVFVATTRLR